MIREALAHLHWSWLPVISMLLFSAVFVGVLLWSYRRGSAEIYKEMSQLPLNELRKSHE
jgi:cbb3-type cytochrome oxidase subunit 3